MIMINITERYKKWYDKIHAGSASIRMITREKGSWYLIFERKSVKLTALRILIFDGDAMTRTIYSDATPEEHQCSLLIKDDQKLILSRGESGLDAFGMESSDSTAKMVICYARTPQVHILITAHRDSPYVNVMYCPIYGENDAFSLCMQFNGILPHTSGVTEACHDE